MVDEDDLEYGPGENGKDLRSRRDPKGGHILPLYMLDEAFGRKSPFVAGAPGICVVVRTKPAWTKILAKAAGYLGHWRFVFDGGANPRQRDEQERAAFEALTRGERVFAIGSDMHGSIPPRILAAADVVVDIDQVTLRAVSRAIRSVTKGRPRGLAQEDLQGMDLLDAMVAIRPGTTPACCVRRLKLGKGEGAGDPWVAAAPPISELAGYGEAREWADRLVIDLDLWRRGELPFAAIQRNAVLAGHPGVGKSTFVRSLAKSTGLPLFVSSVGQMFATSAGYLDSIVKAIDELFAKARGAGECAIVFLDEIDGFPSRDSMSGREASWWTPVVNHMLTTLDSAMSLSSSQLIVIGATNHPDRIDRALVRPGRLDRTIWIDLPDSEALSQIYRQHLGQDLRDEDLSALGELAAGSTGADVVGHIQSARGSARAEGRPLSLDHLVKAVCPPSSLPPDALYRAAVHEAGHAVAAIVLNGHEVMNMVLGGIGTGGRVTYRRPLHSLGSAKEHVTEVIQLLAGRAAEEAFTGTVSSGSGGTSDSDLARATGIVAAGKLSYGLGDTLAYVADPSEAVAFLRLSPQLLRVVEAELQLRYRETLDLMRENERVVTAVADALLRSGMLTGDAVREIVIGKRAGTGERHRA